MVVASANNGAVENVTKEIPGRDAIDECWRADAVQLDYFPGIASALLTNDRDDAEGDDVNGIETAVTGWALVSARLGNKRNCGQFVDDFWYRKPKDPEEEHDRLGLLAILKEYERSAPPCTWLEAVATFRQALEHGVPPTKR